MLVALLKIQGVWCPRSLVCLNATRPFWVHVGSGCEHDTYPNAWAGLEYRIVDMVVVRLLELTLSTS